MASVFSRARVLACAAALALASALSAGRGTCAINGTACPPPLWPSNWALSDASICQPSTPGYFTPPPEQPWGLVSLDWTTARTVWAANGLHNGTIEATSIEGCRRLKVAGTAKRCFVYHNQELALESMESQRAVMYDPTKAGWFLQYTDGHAHKNGTIYDAYSLVAGSQYFWDFRVPAAAEYYMWSVLATTDNAYVDGTYTDDVPGLPAEHPYAPGNMSLSPAEVAEIAAATQAVNGELIARAVAAGKYVWQAMGDYDGVFASPTQADCAAWMRARCTPAWQARATTQHFDTANANASIAAFLIVRPPIAFLGNGWESDQRTWRPEFAWDVGVPGGECREAPPGVFSRAWTFGAVTLDCATFTGTIPTSAG